MCSRVTDNYFRGTGTKLYVSPNQYNWGQFSEIFFWVVFYLRSHLN